MNGLAIAGAVALSVGAGFIFAAIRVAALVRRALLFALEQAYPKWVSSAELAAIFGGGVYGVLPELVDEQRLERREELGPALDPDGRPRTLYRWKQ